MKKAIIIAIMASVMLATTVPMTAKANTVTSHNMTVTTTKNTAKVTYKGKSVASYKFSKKPKVKFMSADGLTYRHLSNRKGKTLYIEVCKGIVLNNKGDGKITSTRNTQYNYISYKGTKFHKGDKVRTYLIYNPYTNAEDDIILRFDEKIGG